jgi:GT2 family glycosyltransferase
MNEASPRLNELHKISVIILTYNSVKSITRCLDSLAKALPLNSQVIIIDNASSDETLVAASKYAELIPNLQTYTMPRNLGYASGNDVGADLSNGEFLAFLNPDTMVESNWIDALLPVFAKYPKIAVLQPKLLSMNEKGKFDSAGDYIDSFGNPFSLGGEWGETDHGQYDFPREVFAARGAALVIRRDVFRMIGGFDRSYFLDYEDVDLCWRVRLLGFQIVCIPSSIVYHQGSRVMTLNRLTTRGPSSLRNMFATLLKNYDRGNALKYTAAALFLVAIGAARDVLAGHPRPLMVKFKALWDVFFTLPEIFKERGMIQNHLRKVDDAAVIKYMLKVGLRSVIGREILSTRVGREVAFRLYARGLLERISSFRILV